MSKPEIRYRTFLLVSLLAKSFHECDGDLYLKKLTRILFENLGEEYPNVLAILLKALKEIVLFLKV